MVFIVYGFYGPVVRALHCKPSCYGFKSGSDRCLLGMFPYGATPQSFVPGVISTEVKLFNSNQQFILCFYSSNCGCCFEDLILYPFSILV